MTLAPAKTNGHQKPLAEMLTPRQLEILALVATGKTNQEIARQLFIERRTVERHLMMTYERLGMSPGINNHSGRVRVALAYRQETLMAETAVERGAASACPGHILCEGHKVYCA